MATAHSTKTPDPSRGTAATEPLDSTALESLLGYQARRASIAIGARFFERMAPYHLKQVEYSVLALLARNPGATSRQLCATLDVLPPNLVTLVGTLERRGLIERRPHPRDGRALGLHLTPDGEALARETGQVVGDLEAEAAAALTARERATLRRLLQKLYRPHA